MAGKNKGWIRIDRSIRDSWIWKGESFSKGQAWVDLLLRAAYEDKTFYWNENLVQLKRGQIITSISKLSKDWGWGWRRTVRFLDMLKSDGMITIDSTARGTTLTLVNWDKFQVLGRTDDRANSRTDSRTDDRTDDRHTRNNNNVKQYPNNARARDARNMIGQFQLAPGMRNDYSSMIADLERMNEERNRQERLSGGSWEDGYDEYEEAER